MFALGLMTQMEINLSNGDFPTSKLFGKNVPDPFSLSLSEYGVLQKKKNKIKSIVTILSHTACIKKILFLWGNLYSS